MASASLTAARLRELLHYDPATGIFSRRTTFRQWKAGAPVGSTMVKGYTAVWADGRHYSAHRLAWLYVHGEWPAEQIDHRNGDKADNRIANLRVVTGSVNQQNRIKCQANNSTGMLGVHRWKQYFRADIHVDGRQKSLGYFKTPEEASQAYIEAKRRFHEGNTL